MLEENAQTPLQDEVSDHGSEGGTPMLNRPEAEEFESEDVLSDEQDQDQVDPDTMEVEEMTGRTRMNQMTLEEEEEFSKELSKLLSETSSSKPVVKMDLNLNIAKKHTKGDTVDEDEARMNFTLLSRKGNKAQVRSCVGMAWDITSLQSENRPVPFIFLRMRLLPFLPRLNRNNL